MKPGAALRDMVEEQLRRHLGERPLRQQLGIRVGYLKAEAWARPWDEDLRQLIEEAEEALRDLDRAGVTNGART